MESSGTTILRWEVESLFDGSGGALFGLYCSLDMRSDGGVVKHVFVLCDCRMCGASIIYKFDLISWV